MKDCALTKPLAFAYWGLRRLFRVFFDDGYSDWKALAVICFVELFLVVSGIFLVSVHVGRAAVTWLMHWKLPGFALLSVCVVVSNHCLLRLAERVAEYEPEFRSYSRFKRVLGYVVTAGIVLLAVVLVFHSRGEFIAMARSGNP